MKCTKCGAEIKPGFKFCMSCGTPVASNMQQNNTSESMPKQTTPQSERPVSHPVQDGDKGLGTFFRGGMQAMHTERNRAERQEAEQQINHLADQLGYEVNKPNRNGQASTSATDANAQIHAEQESERARNQRNQDAIEGVDVVRGRAIWNISPGQIARKISERELEDIEKLKGIIVQEGCSAIIFANGELVSTLSAGAYLFYKSAEEEQAALKAAMEKTEKEMDERERKVREQRRQNAPTFGKLGIVGEIGRAGRLVNRLIFGEKKGEQKENVEKRKLDYARILGKITQTPVLSVYLISQRHIPMIFNGTTDADDNFQFTPFRIPTRVLDVDIAVSMQLRISDIHQFATNYLADKSAATTLQFQKMLKPVVESTLKQLMRNLDYERSGLPDPVVGNLKTRIQQAVNQQIFGIECEQVMQITDSSADFDRFRSVERELYCSEKELEYLQRTGEFRNRLATETNSQAVNEASNKEDLRYALQKINKDQLLHDDEMEEFTLMLESQKHLRQAKTQEEEYEALSELKKNRLVKDDEIAALEDALLHNKIDRDSITDVMRITAQQSVDEARMKSEFLLSDERQTHDFDSELRAAQHGQQMSEIDLQNRQREDDYNFSQQQRKDEYGFTQMQRQDELDQQKQQREHDMQRQDRQDELDALERKAHIAQQNMATMQAHEQQMAAMQQQTDQMRINAQTQMNAEQIAASQITGMDAAAQAEFAKTMGSGKENELLKQQQTQQAQLYQQMLQMQQNQGAQSQQQMMEMAKMMQQGMMGMGQQQQAQQQQRFEDQQHRADEYREDAQRQQSRVDNISQQAMDYTTRAHQADVQSNAQNTGDAQPRQNRPQPQKMTYCPNCGGEVAEDAAVCPFCGQPMPQR